MPRKANLIKKIFSEVFNSFNFQYLTVLLIELVQTIMILAITLPIGSILRRNLLSTLSPYAEWNLIFMVVCIGLIAHNVYKIQSAYGVYWDGRKQNSAHEKFIKKLMKYERNIAISIVGTIFSFLLYRLPKILKIEEEEENKEKTD